ncbi:MAG: hypothetical protein RLZ12_873, partial [Bacillota bacterium]
MKLGGKPQLSLTTPQPEKALHQPKTDFPTQQTALARADQ